MIDVPVPGGKMKSVAEFHHGQACIVCGASEPYLDARAYPAKVYTVNVLAVFRNDHAGGRPAPNERICINLRNFPTEAEARAAVLPWLRGIVLGLAADSVKMLGEEVHKPRHAYLADFVAVVGRFFAEVQI